MPDPIDQDVLAIAQAAGLEKALAQFRDDVIAAAKTAAQARGGFTAPDDAAIEPWPPMRTQP